MYKWQIIAGTIAFVLAWSLFSNIVFWNWLQIWDEELIEADKVICKLQKQIHFLKSPNHPNQSDHLVVCVLP